MQDVDDIPGEGEDGDEEPDSKGPRDRAFNPWRFARTDRSKALVDQITGMVESYEGHRAPRKRRRKVADQARFRATIDAVLSDLINHGLLGLIGQIHITRSNQILGHALPFKATALNQRLPYILDKLATRELDFITIRIGHQTAFGQAQSTTIKATARLMRWVAELGLGVADFGLQPHEDVIFLREARTDPRVRPSLIPFVRDQRTEQFRDELRRINTALLNADIGFDRSAVPGKPMVVDQSVRILRRNFTRGRFDCGGRLFGGFWMMLPKAQRNQGLLIDGEEIVELDYAQMAPRLFYAFKRLQPPTRDLYAIPGFGRHRAGIKQVMNSMFYALNPITQMPQGVRPSFESAHKIGDVVDAITAYHSDIADLFYRGLGHEAQFKESQIMVDILLRLQDRGITALPLHDAILVAGSNEHDGREVMLDVFRDHTGLEGSVD